MNLKNFFHLEYESKIRLSLVMFILFLILFSFGTEYIFHQTKRALNQEIQQNLSTVAASASLLWRTHLSATPFDRPFLKKNLEELSLQSDASRITFLSSDGVPLISSREILSIHNLHIFWGLTPESVKRIRNEDRTMMKRPFSSDFYLDSSGNTYISYYQPLESSMNSGEQRIRNRIWVMVEKEVSAFARIENISRLNSLARIGWLVIAGFITMILINNLLRPYRLMLKKAKSERIIPQLEKEKKEGELDSAVRIFEQVIKELKKKEKTLQKLYQQTERKAKDLASYNEYILKSMTSGMIICNHQGEIVQMNQPAEAILSLSESPVIGRHYKAVFREENPICFSIQTAITEQRTFSIPETRLSNKNGESIWLSLNSTPIKDEKDRMLGVVVFLNDLTEIKKLEEEMAFKDKMATLGEMSSGLAHELRNSMGAILGFSKLLKKRKCDPTSQNQAIDGIVNEATSMESMLKRFLAFAKPFQLKIEEVDLKEMIQECLTSVKETLKENRITFQVDSEPILSSIPGDRLLLKQCFQNVIQNAIEAMPNGGELHIRLSEEQFASKEKSMLVEISDTGYGIPKDAQDKIFNPFFTTKEKGTGLGLSLVKKIVSLHKGKIELESDHSKGTTFKIHLPLKSKPDSTQMEEGEGVFCSSQTLCP